MPFNKIEKSYLKSSHWSLHCMTPVNIIQRTHRLGRKKAESCVFPSAARVACMPNSTPPWASRLDVEIVGAGMGAHGLTLRLLTKQVLWEEENYNSVSVVGGPVPRKPAKESQPFLVGGLCACVHTLYVHADTSSADVTHPPLTPV